MPKKAKELSALDIRRLEAPGFYSVGGVPGLSLSIQPSGSKSWILRAMVGAKRRDIGLGGYPEVSLSLARDKAREAKEKIRQGIDPVEERRAARESLIASQSNSVTFAEAARRFMDGKRHEFSNSKHAAQWESTLSTYAFPVMGNLPVNDIELSHILRVLEPDWLKRTETMSRLRGRIESVLAWAIVHGFRQGANVAVWKGNLDAVLPKPGKVKSIKHHSALPWKDIPDFMPELRKREGIAAKALEFLILTATRSGEVRGAVWEEINLKEKVWIIPPERMKANREHRVPLSDAVQELLSQFPRMIGIPYVFPAPRGGMLSDMAMSKVMKRMQVNAVPHGFRSTFRDWAAENTTYPDNVCEQALAHTIPSAVEAAYRRGDLFEKRIALMADWGAYCQNVIFPADVASIERGR